MQNESELAVKVKMEINSTTEITLDPPISEISNSGNETEYQTAK